MAQLDTLARLNKLLSSSTGRDKLGKLVHYGARGVAGLAADAMAAAEKGSAEHARAAWVHAKARALFVRIMDSRRTMRWLASVPILLALRKSVYPWEDSHAYLVAQLGMVFWHVTDHVRWLQQIDWLPGDQARSKRLGFAAFALSSAVSLRHFWGELSKAYAARKREGEGAVDDSQLLKLRLAVVKHFVTVISTLHISELLMSHEAICGGCGAVASAIDLYTLW